MYISVILVFGITDAYNQGQLFFFAVDILLRMCYTTHYVSGA